QTPGAPVLIHRGRVWLIIVLAAGIIAAEWLRHPSLAWAGIEWGCAGAAAAALWPFRDARRVVLVTLIAALALILTLSQRRLTAIETGWPEEREARVTGASLHLQGDLHSAFRRTERVAQAAARISPNDRAAAF